MAITKKLREQFMDRYGCDPSEIELDDISKQAAKELTGEAIQARVKIAMEALDGSMDVDALIKDAEAWNAWKWILNRPESKAMKADAERYEKIKLMSFSQFKDIVSKRMDGTGKTLDELLDEWELPF